MDKPESEPRAPGDPDGVTGAGERPGLGRRQLFERLGWLGVALLGLAGVPATIRFLMPKRLAAGRTIFDAGTSQDYLGVSVSTKWIRRHGVWVVQDHGGIFVLQADCPHLGCTPRWEPQSGRFRCPCHGSLFSLEGAALRGPARDPLKRVAVWIEHGRILIDPSDCVGLEEAEARPGYYVTI